MSFLEVFIIGVGLSMDAFAVSICKGLSMKTLNWKNGIKAGLFFGGFQALMPIIGYIVGVQFSGLIQNIDHWIAFILLMFIGLKMIKESRDEENEVCGDFDIKSMTILAIATSIDALAVGITFAFLSVDIVSSSVIIGCTTFFFGILGIKIGNVFGIKYKAKAELFGGCILMLIGGKILLEHIFF
ncbi:MAG: manganese efflux pump MntP family protein [Lachnospiraceae bacterium]